MISDQLRDELLAFRKERDWEQFHNLRTLSTSSSPERPEAHLEHRMGEGRRPAAPSRSRFGGARPTLAAEHRPPVHEPGLAEEMADIAGRRTVTSGGAETYLAHDLHVDLETAACLRQVNAPEAGDQRRQVPRASPSRSFSEGWEKAKGLATKWGRL